MSDVDPKKLDAWLKHLKDGIVLLMLGEAFLMVIGLVILGKVIWP